MAKKVQNIKEVEGKDRRISMKELLKLAATQGYEIDIDDPGIRDMLEESEDLKLKKVSQNVTYEGKGKDGSDKLASNVHVIPITRKKGIEAVKSLTDKMTAPVIVAVDMACYYSNEKKNTYSTATSHGWIPFDTILEREGRLSINVVMNKK